ncbi:DUF4383 domain-containing protein [Brevibacterium samyangense]|uniref:DUF4383 domain-containing protein n=1 Tax=Brevibacterium samyangense TaxID=366888 RepID=UPI0031DAD12C
MPNSLRPYRTSIRQWIVLGYGLVFLVVGILGFFPGITTHHDTMEFAGPDSRALFLGLFQVSLLHNGLHLAYGLLAFLAAQRSLFACVYLLWGGLLYAVLVIWGLVVPVDSAANLVPLNTADNWLHLGLAVTMITAALVPGLDRQPARTPWSVDPNAPARGATSDADAPTSRQYPEDGTPASRRRPAEDVPGDRQRPVDGRGRHSAGTAEEDPS